MTASKKKRRVMATRKTSAITTETREYKESQERLYDGERKVSERWAAAKSGGHHGATYISMCDRQ